MTTFTMSPDNKEFPKNKFRLPMKEDTYVCKSFKLSAHKYLELQFSRWSCAKMFDWSFWHRVKEDHPGVEVTLTLFWHEFRVDFYDHRHWDRVHDCYETEDSKPSLLKEGYCPVHGDVLLGQEKFCTSCDKYWNKPKGEYGSIHNE